MITESNDIILDHDFNALKVDISDQILTITLNRPERLNTFDEGMKEDLRWIERRIEDIDDIRVLSSTRRVRKPSVPGPMCLGSSRNFQRKDLGSSTAGFTISSTGWNGLKSP